MKKFMYLGAAALAGLFATSCASDEPVVGTDGMTTFTVQMPEDLTRTFGDGLTANQLYVAIYDADPAANGKLLFTNFTGVPTNEGMSVEPAGGKKWTVKVNLVKNKSYDLVFWAQNSTTTNAAPYKFDADARTITVDYANMANYDEARDAFYRHVTYTSTTPDEQNITLTRAFAQINIGTTEDDLKAYIAAGGNNNFAMAISGASTELNLFTDAVSKPTTAAIKTTPVTPATLTTDANAREQLSVTPAGATEPSKYDYLAMAYVLVGADGTKRDNLTVSLYNQEIAEGVQAFATYPNVPAQMNYRTNIFGQLLTNPETFNVVIDNEFNKDDINYFVPVSTEADFNAAIAAGKCPVLQQDITVTTITPVGGNASVDLNNHTLSTINTSAIAGNVSIKNGTLDINMEKRVAEGGAKGRITLLNLVEGGNLSLDNVTVKDTENVHTAIMMLPAETWAKAGSITLNNCNIAAYAFGVSTNASNAAALASMANLPYTITINNSNITAHTGVMFNVPGTLVMDKCNVTGDYQGVIVRGGTATITDCDITTTCNEPAYEFDDYNWASGNGVPISAMTVGNDGIYNFAINVTTTGCTFNVLKGALTQIWLDKSGNRRINVPCVFAKKGTAKDVNVTLNGSKYNNAIGGQDVYNEDATVK